MLIGGGSLGGIIGGASDPFLAFSPSFYANASKQGGINGNPVDTLTNYGTNATITATQTGTARATYIASGYDGKPAFRFDGINDFYALSNPPLTDGNASNTVIVVLAKRVVTAGFSVPFEIGNGGVGNERALYTRTVGIEMTTGGGLTYDAAMKVGSDLNVQQNYAFASQYTGSGTNTLKGFMRGAEIATATASGTMARNLNQTRRQIGRWGISNWWDGDIKLIAFFPGVALSDADIETLLAWGLTQ